MSDLKFDWETVAERSVLAVTGRNQQRMDDGSLTWDALAFRVGDDAVVLTVTPDSDEIVVSHEPAPEGEDWDAIPALGDAVGKLLGWCWVGTNSQGYRDSFTLALANEMPTALQPRLTFLAEASSLSCFDLTARKV